MMPVLQSQHECVMAEFPSNLGILAMLKTFKVLTVLMWWPKAVKH